jgi:hypothetical protein
VGGASQRGIPAAGEGTQLRRAPYHTGKIRQVELATPGAQEGEKDFAQFVSRVRAATPAHYLSNCILVLSTVVNMNTNGCDPNVSFLFGLKCGDPKCRVFFFKFLANSSADAKCS